MSFCTSIYFIHVQIFSAEFFKNSIYSMPYSSDSVTKHMFKWSPSPATTATDGRLARPLAELSCPSPPCPLRIQILIFCLLYNTRNKYNNPARQWFWLIESQVNESIPHPTPHCIASYSHLRRICARINEITKQPWK
jgi:hypothetical protein